MASAAEGSATRKLQQTRASSPAARSKDDSASPPAKTKEDKQVSAMSKLKELGIKDVLRAVPTQWVSTKGDQLDWRTLVMISRPGWWLVHVWLYLAPTGQKYHLLTTPTFWLGLAYALFPLNLLVYGLNDYTDVELDSKNDRKGNFMYGAKCTREQMRDLPLTIVVTNVLGMVILALSSGHWGILALWLAGCFACNAAYNCEPLRLSSNGPWELPCVVFGFSCVTRLSSIVNNLPTAPIGYWAHMTCLVLRTQLWTEFLDFEPDSACNRRTTSTLLGRTCSKFVVVFLLALEAVVTWYFFEDFLMRLFSCSGVVAFFMLEVVKGTTDKEKKKAMKVQNGLGLCLVFWIWHRGLFAAK